jgi:hypothetical protein
MKKDQKIKPLSDWEWDLTWSSLRYFCGRYSIASAMYPSDLVRNFGKRLSDDQKEQLSQEIQKQIEDAIRLEDNMWLTTDMENWSALRNYFDKSTWMELECEGEGIKKTSIVAFPCEHKDLGTMVTKWIPVDNYENTGSTRTMINEDYIKQIKKYEPK